MTPAPPSHMRRATRSSSSSPIAGSSAGAPAPGTQLARWSRSLHSAPRFRPRGVSGHNPSTCRPALTLTALGPRTRAVITLPFRVSRRPSGKARGGRMVVLFNRRATPPGGMHQLSKWQRYYRSSPRLHHDTNPACPSQYSGSTTIRAFILPIPRSAFLRRTRSGDGPLRPAQLIPRPTGRHPGRARRLLPAGPGFVDARAPPSRCVVAP